MPRRGGTAPSVRSRGAPEPGQLRHQRSLPGEVRGERAPHRGADLRRWRGTGGGAGRARLFGAAPQSEGDRGDAGARPAGRGAQRPVRCRAAVGARGELSIGRHGGVHLRQRHRRLVFPGSEYAPAGGARRHRRGHRHRPGGMDGAAGGGRDAAAGHFRDSAARVFAPGAPVCRGSRQGISAQRGTPLAGRVAGRRARGNLGGIGHGSHSVLRPHARQDHRARRRSRVGAGAHARRAGGVPRLRHRDQSRVPAAGDGRCRFRSGRHHDVVPARLRLSPPRRRCDRIRRADHRAGLSGTARLLACRRAAFRSDGRPGVPRRQSTGGK